MRIIEDEPLHAQLLDRSLRHARYRTNVASHGVTGLADAKRLNPSLVLLDLQLPGMSGLEVCRHIRSSAGIGHTPIMMISALGGEQDRIMGIEMGAAITSPNRSVRGRSPLEWDRSCVGTGDSQRKTGDRRRSSQSKSTA